MSKIGYSQEKQNFYLSYLEQKRTEFYKNWESPFLPKEDLNSFEVLSVLGVGSFSTVFLVQHRDSGLNYAMKALEKKHIIKSNVLKHTKNEKKGGELYSYIKKMGRIQETITQFYCAQVVLALEYLHFCNLIYRDLKPENILIDITGYIKLVDLGFCKMIGNRTWTLCGTPEYMAPEVIIGKGYGNSADWWSLGILIYEMCYGQPPFQSQNTMKLYHKILSCKVKFPNFFSDSLKSILGRLIQNDVIKRYGTQKKDAFEIKNHDWFKTIDWDDISNLKAEPPIKPVIRDSGSNYEIYNDADIIALLKNTSRQNKYEFEDF